MFWRRRGNCCSDEKKQPPHASAAFGPLRPAELSGCWTGISRSLTSVCKKNETPPSLYSWPRSTSRSLPLFRDMRKFKGDVAGRDLHRLRDYAGAKVEACMDCAAPKNRLAGQSSWPVAGRFFAKNGSTDLKLGSLVLSVPSGHFTGKPNGSQQFVGLHRRQKLCRAFGRNERSPPPRRELFKKAGSPAKGKRLGWGRAGALQEPRGGHRIFHAALACLACISTHTTASPSG